MRSQNSVAFFTNESDDEEDDDGMHLKVHHHIENTLENEDDDLDDADSDDSFKTATSNPDEFVPTLRQTSATSSTSSMSDKALLGLNFRLSSLVVVISQYDEVSAKDAAVLSLEIVDLWVADVQKTELLLSGGISINSIVIMV